MPQRFIDETVAGIQKTVGRQAHAICALSGGVDSSVAATLVARAIGDRLTCVFVNNGVLRKDEFEKVQQNLRQAGMYHGRVDGIWGPATDTRPKAGEFHQRCRAKCRYQWTCIVVRIRRQSGPEAD